ncbi:MAG TPA: PEGA domain-containing protein [Candidatus Saccharimonadales bacterium]|jgi:hypothetical protein
MDFLDPQKQRAHMIRLISGYILIGVAILFATLILLYQAYGFGLGKDGEVIQKGLVFVSSQPDAAKIYLDGKLYKSTTNTKLQLEAGEYKTELQREGYRSWQRIITVEGGSVQHFDYPKLFPTAMTTSPVKTYAETPGFATQSPDRRWIVVQQGASLFNFDVFDVADPAAVNDNVTAISLPEAIVTTARSTAHTYKLVEWSTDNRHLLVEHSYTPEGAAATLEYLMIDREEPAASLNLTKSLGLTAGKVLTLRDKKHDKYYVYDSTAKTLSATTLDDAGTLTNILDQVLAYKTYGNDMVLYATDKDISTDKSLPSDKTQSVLYDDKLFYKIREHGATGPFLLDIAEYSNDWYAAVGASGDSKVYVYKNPQQIRKSSQTAALVPVRILRVTSPNHVAFSSNTQFIMAENGVNFANYDAENDKGYNYTSSLPLDAPATHARWMDGHRLSYVSGGKLVVFDYDNINAQTLVAASPNYTPFFDRDYDNVYTMVPATNQSGVTTITLSVSSLLLPEDQ